MVLGFNLIEQASKEIATAIHQIDMMAFELCSSLPEHVEEGFRFMGYAADGIQIKEAGATLEGMKQPEYCIHHFQINFTRFFRYALKVNDQRLCLIDHLSALFYKTKQNFLLLGIARIVGHKHLSIAIGSPETTPDL
jgi:hypothetical protein